MDRRTPLDGFEEGKVCTRQSLVFALHISFSSRFIKNYTPRYGTYSICCQYNNIAGDRGSTLVKVLCYKSEGRCFDPSWCQLIFFFDTKSFRSHYGPGVDSASNRNEYQEYFLGGKGGRCVRMTTTTILCRCHEIWEP